MILNKFGSSAWGVFFFSLSWFLSDFAPPVVPGGSRTTIWKFCFFCFWFSFCFFFWFLIIIIIVIIIKINQSINQSSNESFVVCDEGQPPLRCISPGVEAAGPHIDGTSCPPWNCGKKNNQSINQSINQSSNQWINESINQSFNQSTKKQ